MGRRIVTPYSSAPSHDLLKVVHEAYPISPWDEDSGSISDEDAALLKKGIKSVKKKIRFRKSSMGEGGGNKVASSRVRNESLGSNNSWGDEIPEYQRDVDMNELTEKDDTNEAIHHLENDITLSLSNLMLSTSPGTNAPPTPLKTESPWVKIVNNYDKQQRIIQARLKVVTAAKELSVQPTSASFTKLVPMSQQNQNRSLVETSPISGVTMTATDFPELQRSSPPIHYEHSKASGYKHSEMKKVTKLSQKQRKKLAAEQQVGSPETSTSESVQSPPAWGNFSGSDPSANRSLSLVDIMKEEMQLTRVPQSSAPVQQLSTAPGPNPWHRGAENNKKSPQADRENSSVVNFLDIVADEKKQRENWSRMRAKPLQLTQLEDQAIEDLLVFYNAAGATEERITVKRVISGTVAPPTWITSHH